VIAGIFGSVIAAGVVTLIVLSVVFGGRPRVVEVEYSGLASGVSSEALTYCEFERDDGFLCEHGTFYNARVRLLSVDDPSDRDSYLADESRGERAVAFEVQVVINRGGSFIQPNDARLQFEMPDGRRASVDAIRIEVDGRAAPRHIEEGDHATVVLVFVLPEAATPASLSFDPDFAGRRGIRYDFE
jgi:hypothetical protein